MSYQSWFKNHGKKHKGIVLKLVSKGYSKKRIIDYFEFENMTGLEPDFCPLYENTQKCHDIPHLNCYFCGCPFFRFHSDGIPKSNGVKMYSYCHIHSQFGRQISFDKATHQDCSQCPLPHGRRYVSSHFDFSWFNAMRNCENAEGRIYRIHSPCRGILNLK